MAEILLGLRPESTPFFSLSLEQILGCRSGESEDYPQAIETFSRAIAMHPRPFAGYLARGLTYELSGEPMKAIADYTAVLNMPDAPANQVAIALVNRGLTYMQLSPSRYEEAITDFTAVIDMPDAPASQVAVALSNRGVTYGRLSPPRYEEMREDFEAVVQMPNISAEIRAMGQNSLGELLRWNGRLTEAADAYRAAIQLDSNHSAAYYNLGLTYYRLNRPYFSVQAYLQGFLHDENALDAAQSLTWRDILSGRF